MAVKPIQSDSIAPLRLESFQDRFAQHVTSWVRDDDELFELAPRQMPPLTAEKVIAWQIPDGQAWLLHERDTTDAIGYGELNLLGASQGECWLGHIIIDPLRRGRGLGSQLVCLLLERAFNRLHAQRVSLVVFPSNCAAVACYRAAGFSDAGCESHFFPARSRRCRLLRMTVARE